MSIIRYTRLICVPTCHFTSSSAVLSTPGFLGSYSNITQAHKHFQQTISFHSNVHNNIKPVNYHPRHNFLKTSSTLCRRGDVVVHGLQLFHSRPLGPNPTIYALSSGHGKCGVSVIRISGPRCAEAVLRVTRKRALPAPRVAVLHRFYDVTSSEAIDRGLLLWFPGPESFTGEDCCELHVHGGPAVLSAMFSSLSNITGLRQAEAGEFTKRAFEHGKLDLTEVEGLADLIHAETETQRQQALRQMEGALSLIYTSWRGKLLKCCADVEAFIDFSEEENIEGGLMERVETTVLQVTKEIEAHLHDNRRGERLRSGVHIAIIGQPNVGKSSLLNVLCRRPAAIVSPVAGTTRDVVEAAMNLGGYPVVLSDTAGLRDTHDIVESEGVRRAIHRARDADIKVVVLDITNSDTRNLLLSTLSSGGSTHTSQHKSRLLDFFHNHLKDLGVSNEALTNISNSEFGKSTPITSENTLNNVETSAEKFNPSECIILFNKADLYETDQHKTDLFKEVMEGVGGTGKQAGLSWCCVSCVTEQGLDHFLDTLLTKVKVMCGNPSSRSPSLTQARHRDNLTQCVVALYEYIKLSHSDVVLAANSLQMALRYIGKITGKITSEEILDVIFRDFCIGK